MPECTEAERALLEAIMDGENARRPVDIQAMRQRVAKERLARELPEWEEQARQLFRAVTVADRKWRKMCGRLGAAGIIVHGEGSIALQWWDELEAEGLLK